MSANKNLIKEVENAIVIDDMMMEPTDSEGWNLEGTVEYNGREYPVEMFGKCGESYKHQAATQIAEKLS